MYFLKCQNKRNKARRLEKEMGQKMASTVLSSKCLFGACLRHTTVLDGEEIVLEDTQQCDAQLEQLKLYIQQLETRKRQELLLIEESCNEINNITDQLRCAVYETKSTYVIDELKESLKTSLLNRRHQEKQRDVLQAAINAAQAALRSTQHLQTTHAVTHILGAIQQSMTDASDPTTRTEDVESQARSMLQVDNLAEFIRNNVATSQQQFNHVQNVQEEQYALEVDKELEIIMSGLRGYGSSQPVMDSGSYVLPTGSERKRVTFSDTLTVRVSEDANTDKESERAAAVVVVSDTEKRAPTTATSSSRVSPMSPRSPRKGRQRKKMHNQQQYVQLSHQ